MKTKIVFTLFLITQFNLSFAILFSILAQKDNLYTELITLRTLASDHLEELLHQMREELRVLKIQGRLVKADYLSDLYQRIFDQYSDRLDIAFNDLDEMIVLSGGRLDFYSAPDKQKLELVGEIRLEAKRTVVPLINVSFPELKRSWGLSHKQNTKNNKITQK